MNTIAAFDEHLRALTAMAAVERAGDGAGRGPADRLVEVTERIEDRSAAIRRDCAPWQIARATVAATIVEATAAARCYHPPTFISAVLSRQERDPRFIARAVEYLTHVIAYVSEHQPDDYATLERAEDRLDRLSQVVRDTIEERVMAALGALPRAGAGGSQKKGGRRGGKKRGGGAADKGVADLVFPVQQRSAVPPALGYLNTPRGQRLLGGLSSSPYREGTVLGGGGGASAYATVFPSAAVLEGLGDLCKRAFAAFEDTSEEQFSCAIPNLILAKIRSILDPMFDGRYAEEYEPWIAEMHAGGRLPPDEAALAPSLITRDITYESSTDPIEYVSAEDYYAVRGGRRGGGGGAAPSRRNAGMASALGQRRHYRKGAHSLLRISATARALVLEASEALERFLIAPLSDAACVVDVPDRIACAVFRGIIRHAKHCIYVSERLIDADSTAVFIATGGAGPGMASMDASRNVRDAIFIGLDLVEELWQWRNHVAPSLRGTHDTFDLLVEDELRDYCSLVLDLLNHYRGAKGQVDEGMLLEDDALRAAGKAAGVTVGLEGFTVDSVAGGGGGGGRRSWFPSPDCSTHESTINLIYLLRTLFVDYFGSLKLVLSDGDVAASDPDAALEFVKDFVEDCVEGHISDIGTIGDAAAMLQRRDQERIRPDASKLAANARKMAKMVSLLPRQTMSTIPRPFSSLSSQQSPYEEAAEGGVGGGGGLEKNPKGSDIGARASGSGKTDVHISPPIFVLNNLYYLAQNLQQPFFSRRTQVVLRDIALIRSNVVANANSLSAGLGLGAQRTIGGAMGGSAEVSAVWSRIAAKQKKGAAEAEAEAARERAAAQKKRQAEEVAAAAAASSRRGKGHHSAKPSSSKKKASATADTDENEEEEEDEEWEEEEWEEYEEEEDEEEGGAEEEEEEEGDALPTTAPPAFGAMTVAGGPASLSAAPAEPTDTDDGTAGDGANGAAAGGGGGRKRTRRIKVPLLETLVDSIKERGGGWVLAYREEWADVFPSFSDRDLAPADVYSVYRSGQTASSAPLSVAQKEALKLHHQMLCCLLTDAVNDGMVHIMSDPLLKTILVQQAAEAVAEGFASLADELIRGRQWTVSANKYLGRSPNGWVMAVKGIL